MTTLKELQTSKTENAEVNTTFQYVIDLQEKLDDTCKMTEEQLVKSSVRYKKYYNRKAQDKRLNKGSKVLLLLPTKRNKLLLLWKGSYVVTEVANSLDYRIYIEVKMKTCNANMLKQYHDLLMNVVMLDQRQVLK